MFRVTPAGSRLERGTARGRPARWLWLSEAARTASLRGSGLPTFAALFLCDGLRL
jgi:hypothetical protein